MVCGLLSASKKVDTFTVKAQPHAPNLVLWLDASDNSTLTTSNDGNLRCFVSSSEVKMYTTVTVWRDKSTNRLNATASNGTLYT
jgi:hypothetical protein